MELHALAEYDVWMNKLHFALLLALSSLLMPCSMGEGKSDVVAEVQGFQILQSDLEEKAAKSLEQLETERLRFEAQQIYKRHRVLENALNSLTAEKVLNLEAEAQGVSKEELVKQEVDTKVEPPTDEQVEAYYNRNKRRFQGDKEEALPHVRKIVSRNKIVTARNNYINSLKDKYGLTTYLPPLRMDVESEGHPFMGPIDAPVTIVEFSDFECPYCSRLAKTVKKVATDYSDRVKLVFRQFPLHRIHPNAQKAAEAALCAADQGKFWEMHDLLFEDQKNLKIPDLKDKAASIGLQAEEFAQCLETSKHAEAVSRDLYDGVRAGVTGTPAMFINGRPLSGQVPYESLAKIVEEELLLESNASKSAN
jgi:protein-disulfide isomerase